MHGAPLNSMQDTSTLQGSTLRRPARVVVADSTVPRSDALRSAWQRFHLAHGAKPVIGAVIVGGAALAIAANVGALELTIGALSAYTAYRMLRYGIDLKDALLQSVELEEAVRREL
jgi:hypothetical protein